MAGLPLDNLPGFTDRGAFLAAARVLKVNFGIELSLKLCQEHLIRNANYLLQIKVKSETNLVRRAVGEYCSSKSIVSWNETIQRIYGYFPRDKVFLLMRLLLLIHPVSSCCVCQCTRIMGRGSWKPDSGDAVGKVCH